MKRVYLAGSISGLTYEEAVRNREYVADILKPLVAVSPMRGKEELQGSETLRGEDEFYRNNKNPFSRPSGIVCRDRHDVMTCDAVMMDLSASRITGKISLGSMVELGWADAFRKPVVVVWGFDHECLSNPEAALNPHEHIFVRQLAGFHAETCVQAAQILKTILL